MTFPSLWYRTHRGNPVVWTGRITRQSWLAYALIRLAAWIDDAPSWKGEV